MADFGTPATTQFSGTSADEQLQFEDLAKFYPDGNNAVTVIELMSEVNHILPHMIWKPSSHMKFEQRTYENHLPEADDIIIGTGSRNVKVGYGAWTEQINALQTRSKIDAKLIQYAPGNAMALRTNQERGIVRGMSHQIARRLFYGNRTTNPLQFDGLATRFASKAHKSVWTVGNTTAASNTSVYLVRWDVSDGFYGFYPQNHPMMGIDVTPLGQSTVFDENGREHEVFRTRYDFDWGVAVADPRNVMRVADINPNAATNNIDPRVLVAAFNHMNTQQGVWIYVSRAVATQLDVQMIEKANVEHEPRNPWGYPVRWFMGIPLALCDAISLAEPLTAA